MRRGDLVYTNCFGEKNFFGIIVEAKKLPKDALEYYACKVLLPGGKIKTLGSSYLLTADEIEEFFC